MRPCRIIITCFVKQTTRALWHVSFVVESYSWIDTAVVAQSTASPSSRMCYNLLLKKIGAFSASFRLVIVGLVIFLIAFDVTGTGWYWSLAMLQFLGWCNFPVLVFYEQLVVAYEMQDARNSFERNGNCTTCYEGLRHQFGSFFLCVWRLIVGRHFCPSLVVPKMINTLTVLQYVSCKRTAKENGTVFYTVLESTLSHWKCFWSTVELVVCSKYCIQKLGKAQCRAEGVRGLWPRKALIEWMSWTRRWCSFPILQCSSTP